MSMIDTVRSSMMEAMKNKDKVRKDALSALLQRLLTLVKETAFPTKKPLPLLQRKSSGLKKQPRQPRQVMRQLLKNAMPR